MDDVILRKMHTIDRCLNRINIEFGDDFKTNITKQDSVILNIQRACEATIDIGNRLLRKNQYATPSTTRDIFDVLNANKFITNETAQAMKNMVGFRNIAVHDYQNISIDVVIAIVENHLQDFLTFTKEIAKSELDG